MCDLARRVPSLERAFRFREGSKSLMIEKVQQKMRFRSVVVFARGEKQQ
jgi:hypothetical protein